MEWNGNNLGRNGAEISSHRLGSQQEHIHLSVSPGCDNSSAARHVAALGHRGKGECTAVLHPKTELCFLFTSSVTGLNETNTVHLKHKVQHWQLHSRLRRLCHAF